MVWFGADIALLSNFRNKISPSYCHLQQVERPHYCNARTVRENVVKAIHNFKFILVQYTSHFTKTKIGV